MSHKLGNADSSNKWIISTPAKYIPNQRGLGVQYFEFMKKYNDHIAQYIVDTKEEDTYGELLERCIRTSLNLKQQYNFNKDKDVIMLCTNNHKNSCVPFLASVFLGIRVASLDPNLSSMDITHFLKEVHPTILFVVPEIIEVVETSLYQAGVSTEIVVFGKSLKYKNFDEFLIPHNDEKTFIPTTVNSLQDPIVIVFSSGTSGLPKGILLNHYTVGAQTFNVIDRGSMRDVHLAYTSLYWISGILCLSVAICTGGARVICSRFDAKKIWNIISTYKVSSTFLSPVYTIDILNGDCPTKIDTSSLEVFSTGGSSISEACLEKLREYIPGTIVLQGYGQSEVAGPLTIYNLNDIAEKPLIFKKPNTSGTLVAGITCKVVDVTNDSICGPYEQGELRVKSKIMMNGYYNRDSSESFDSDGWLRTGDIVYFDEDLCFYVVDRIKQMLKYKSWHVSPVMVENILLEHPAVNQVVVIGIPHPEDGDHPMAIILPSENYKNKITKEEIANFLTHRAPDRMKLRGGVKFVDFLPVTPTGKIMRREIKNMILEGKL